MRDELAGRVGLRAREQHHADAARAGRHVLQSRRVRRVRLKAPPHQPLLLLGFDDVLPERARQLGVPRHARCSEQLLQRLHFDRMDVRQVLRELLFERFGHAALLPETVVHSRGGLRALHAAPRSG